MILEGITGGGLVWAISQVLFGLGIERIGIGLGFAIAISLAAVTSSLVPLLLYGPQSEGIKRSHFLIGICLALFGVGSCSVASTRREQGSKERVGNARLGLLFCIGGGVGGAMINVGMVPATSRTHCGTRERDR